MDALEKFLVAGVVVFLVDISLGLGITESVVASIVHKVAGSIVETLIPW